MMNQGDLFKKIGNILNELQDQYQYLAENPQDLNELELELFLSNANFLTDHIHIVIKANSHHDQKVIEAPVSETTKINHTEGSFSPDKEPDTFQFLINDEDIQDEKVSQNKFEFEEKAVNEIFNRPLTPEEQYIIAQKQLLKSQEKINETVPLEEPLPEPIKIEVIKEEPFVPAAPEPVVEKEQAKKEEPVHVEVMKLPATEEVIPEQEVVIPELKESSPKAPVAAQEAPVKAAKEAPVKLTLNEMLAAGNLNGSRVPETPAAEIKDLKQAISLNDKLLFVKDLFHGYNLAYAEVIDLLNKMPDFKTADAFLQKNYAIKNDWQSKQETVDRFYEPFNETLSG